MSKYIKKYTDKYNTHKSYLGERFGKLTIIEDNDIDKTMDKRKVKCKCDCGNIVENISLNNLVHNISRKVPASCETCRQNERLKNRGLIGKRFDKLVIAGATGKKDKWGDILVLCKCDCGNTVEIPSSRFNTKRPPKNCGCADKSVYVGLKVGKLEVIKFTGKYYADSKIWLCKCDCGNIIEVKATLLSDKKYPKTHCGCSPKTNLQDLTGKRFGKLIVIKQNGLNKYGSAEWLCKCDCGNTVVRTQQQLVKNKNSSCGCNKETLIGQRFDKVIVMSYDIENKKWLCKCDCGNTILFTTRQLKNKKSIHCGCEELKDKIDLTGITIGRLTVLNIIEDSRNRKHRVWLCRCDCGSIIKRRELLLLKYIKDGVNCDCGCKGLIGTKYGKLTIIAKPENNGEKWLCRCDCGTEVEVRLDYLRSGHTKSCGCIQSHGEERIGRILQDNNIKYEKEKRFQNLVSMSKCGLRIDFYLPEYNCAIEYDGVQHFSLRRTGWDTEYRYAQRIENDFLKVQYCLDNNIILIKIPYTHRDTVNLIDLLPETSLFVIKSIDEYNTYLEEYKDIKKYYKFYKN